MAFIKRTWLARLGTGLNKFLIGDKGADGKQTLTNSPDTVVQEGDVISADNLNDLEDRIEDGLDDLEAQTQTALDAKADITTLNNAIARVKLTKVWENPSPTESFSSQSFVLESYNGTCEYVIEFRYANPVQGSNAHMTEFKHFKMYNPSLAWIDVEFMNYNNASLNTFYLRSRLLSIRLQDNIVYGRIGDCYQVGVNTNSTITVTMENDQLIPVAIYKVGDIYNS